jgi:hypothetical protein
VVSDPWAGPPEASLEVQEEADEVGVFPGDMVISCEITGFPDEGGEFSGESTAIRVRWVLSR